MFGEDDPNGYKFTLEFRVGDETGVCSDGSSTTSSTCESSDGVWTWESGDQGNLAGSYDVTISVTHNAASSPVREYTAAQSTAVTIGSGLGPIDASQTQCVRCSSGVDVAIAGVASSFDLEVRDADGTLVPAGVQDANGKDSVVFTATSDGLNTTVEVVGSVYRVHFTAYLSGTLSFDVEQDSEPLSLQPSVTVVPADPSVEQTMLEADMPGMTAGVPGSFGVILKDQFSNEISAIDASTALLIDLATGTVIGCVGAAASTFASFGGAVQDDSPAYRSICGHTRFPEQRDRVRQRDLLIQPPREFSCVLLRHHNTRSWVDCRNTARWSLVDVNANAR